MDNKINERIDSLLSHIELIERDVKTVDTSELTESSLFIRATAFSISQIGEQMVKMEELLKDKYPNLPWKNARGLRNYIVHDYDSVDIDQLLFTVKNDLPVLKYAFQQIKKDLESK